mmetsp:Transcript_63854/g.103225  ORF Transcript_63854/g.103225 Transcript_63854/m.103225 type:complete len:85 (-) Transcript_63854:127-381(-)
MLRQDAGKFILGKCLSIRFHRTCLSLKRFPATIQDLSEFGTQHIYGILLIIVLNPPTALRGSKRQTYLNVFGQGFGQEEHTLST